MLLLGILAGILCIICLLKLNISLSKIENSNERFYNMNRELSNFEKELLQTAIAKLRINVKSLATEAVFIRQEIKKCRNETIKGILNTHRIENVRKESRATQLALASLRRIPYIVVEKDSKTQPDWKRIQEKLSKNYLTQDIKKEINNWIEEAKKKFNI